LVDPKRFLSQLLGQLQQVKVAERIKGSRIKDSDSLKVLWTAKSRWN